MGVRTVFVSAGECSQPLQGPPQTLSLFLLPRFVVMGQAAFPMLPKSPLSYFPKEIKNTESAQYCSYCGTGWCWAKVLSWGVSG